MIHKSTPKLNAFAIVAKRDFGGIYLFLPFIIATVVCYVALIKSFLYVAGSW